MICWTACRKRTLDRPPCNPVEHAPMDLRIMKALRASPGRRLDGKRSAFGLLVGYRLSLYRKNQSSPMLEAEFRWRDGLSRFWFEIEDGCLNCWAECDDRWQGKARRLIRRTP